MYLPISGREVYKEPTAACSTFQLVLAGERQQRTAGYVPIPFICGLVRQHTEVAVAAPFEPLAATVAPSFRTALDTGISNHSKQDNHNTAHTCTCDLIAT